MAVSLGAEIALYLQHFDLGLNWNGTGDINLYVSIMPDVPDRAVAIYERGGLSPLMVLTGGGYPESKFERASFQVRVREDMDKYEQGDALADAIYSKLHGIVETHINGSTYQLFHLIQAIHPPSYLGRDDKQRHEWSQNFWAWYENDSR